MNARQLHHEKYEAQLKEWGAKVDAFKAHAEKLTAQAKLDLKPRVDAAHAKLEVAKDKLQKVAHAADDGWEAAKVDADTAWHEVKASVEGAYDALKAHTKT